MPANSNDINVSIEEKKKHKKNEEEKFVETKRPIGLEIDQTVDNLITQPNDEINKEFLETFSDNGAHSIRLKATLLKYLLIVS